MRSIFLPLIFLFIGFGIVGSGSVKKSAGAPPGSTGAPNDQNSIEGSCANSGCHTANSVNDGNATISLTKLNGEPGKYVPGQAVELELTIDKTGFEKFGFQAVALKTYNDSTIVNSGNLKIWGDDALRTQVLDHPAETGNLSGRKYITHTNEGNQGGVINSNSWKFLWEPPDTLTRDVTIYGIGLAANGDLETTGDYVYTVSITLSQGSPNGEKESIENTSYSLFPNPVSSNFTITGLKTIGSVSIYNVNGKLVKSTTAVSTNTISCQDLPKGTYFAQFQNKLKKSKILKFIKL